MSRMNWDRVRREGRLEKYGQDRSDVPRMLLPGGDEDETEPLALSCLFCGSDYPEREYWSHIGRHHATELVNSDADLALVVGLTEELDHLLGEWMFRQPNINAAEQASGILSMRQNLLASLRERHKKAYEGIIQAIRAQVPSKWLVVSGSLSMWDVSYDLAARLESQIYEILERSAPNLKNLKLPVAFAVFSTSVQIDMEARGPLLKNPSDRSHIQALKKLVVRRRKALSGLLNVLRPSGYAQFAEWMLDTSVVIR